MEVPRCKFSAAFRQSKLSTTLMPILGWIWGQRWWTSPALLVAFVCLVYLCSQILTEVYKKKEKIFEIHQNLENVKTDRDWPGCTNQGSCGSICTTHHQWATPPSAPPTSGPHHPQTTDFSRQTRFRMPLTQFGQLFFPKISRKRPSSSSSVNDLSFIYSRLGHGWRKHLCI